MTFNIKNTRIELSFWFAAVITLLLLVLPESNAAACFILCVLHELGHLTAMLLFKCRPQKVSFGFFGMKIETDTKLISPLKEIIIAASGSFVNLALAAIFILIHLYEEAVISTALAVFNLLPVPMLDGGHILSAMGTKPTALKIIGVAVAVLILGVGIAVAIYSRSNFNLLIIGLYILTGTLA